MTRQWRETLLAICLALLAACDRPGTTAPIADEAQSLGLPPVPFPPDNPQTLARIDLGRKLFFDRRLSPNDTMSCAMCHVPEQGFAANELATAVGLEGRSIRRNAPTVLNVAFHPRLFHDGREISLENQVWGPLLAANEMGNPSIGYLVERLRSLADYAGLFEGAFGGHGPDMTNIGQALAAYERTLVSGNSPFDRYRYGGEASVLDTQERSGLELFTGKAGCSTCHLIGDKHALLSDFRFHNTGIGWRHAHADEPEHQVQTSRDSRATLSAKTIATFAEPESSDVGRFEITLDPADRWAYKTPSLRNVALTAPYMHDGSLETLEAVVDFYDAGGIDNENKSPLLKPLGLTNTEKAGLVAFLKTLTGSSISTLMKDARKAPPGQ